MKKHIKIILLILGISLFLSGCKAGSKEKDDELVEIPPVEDQIEDNETEDELQDDEIYEPQLAPNFTLKNLQGEDVSLEDYRGKIVFLNFWASWCVYCDLEMPDLQRISDENDDVVVVGVNSMEDKKTVEKYIDKNNLTFDILLDEDGEVSGQYYVSGLPTTYFLDKDGYITGYYPGALDYETFSKIVESIREESSN